MPTKTRAAAVESLSGGSPFSGKPLGREAFKFRFNNLLKSIEKDAPHKKARELENRITEGGRKIEAAKDKLPAEKIQEAIVRLNDLKGELVALNREYIVPHHVFHMIHYLLDLHDRQEWPLTGEGTLTIDLPGVLSISVEVPRPVPF